MNLRNRLLSALFTALASLAICLPAVAQWQVPSGAYAIGRGSGTGFTSLLCGSAQLAVGQTAAAPICRTMSGDATLAATGALTLATVNSNVGSFGSATQCVAITTNGKGLITAASHATCTPAVGSITGLGTGVGTWLATPSSANLASAITDETGSGALVFGTSPTIGGLLNVSGAVKYSTQSAPSQITSNQNDYNPSSVVCASSTTLLINSDAARDITGLAGGVAGCVMALVNNGSQTITLKEESASSTAGNRFKTGGDIALAASATVSLLYDGTASRWRMTSPASAGGGGGTVTSLVCNGVTISSSGTCPPIFGLVNHSLTASASGSALTIALKNAAGSDPSASSPVNGYFRDVTGTTGSWTQLTVTSALSLTVSSGSTLGVTSSTAFRLWVVLFNDGGTARLGVINCSTASTTAANIYPLQEGRPTSSTAEGGAGAADSAGVIYTGTAVTSKAFLIVGYIEWSSSGLTAGTWTTTNLLYVQSFGPGIYKPGETIRRTLASTTTETSTTSSTYQTTNVSAAIAPVSAANLIRINFGGQTRNSNSATTTAILSIFRDSTQVGASQQVFSGSGVASIYINDEWIDKPNSTSSITYAIKVASQDNATAVQFARVGTTAAGTPAAWGRIIVEEIQG